MKQWIDTDGMGPRIHVVWAISVIRITGYAVAEQVVVIGVDVGEILQPNGAVGDDDIVAYVATPYPLIEKDAIAAIAHDGVVVDRKGMGLVSGHDNAIAAIRPLVEDQLLRMTIP